MARLLRRSTRTLALLAAGMPLALAPVVASPVAPATAVERPQQTRSAPTPPEATTSAGTPIDLGALFIGAHPDDEASTLSALGYWKQEYGVRSGVVTITRGEGGGNAIGPEEGPALGLLREAEERRAVGRAGITDVYNLDEVDFYYTVSQPLTRQTWGHQDVLAKTVRIIRQTRPEVLVTMNPAPSPGQHGHHQEAARIATEAFHAAGDPTRFPEQITREGLEPFAPSRLLLRSAWGTQATGPTCAADFIPNDPTQNVFGVWGGHRAPDGRTWAAIERDAQREYRSQGWAGFPDVPTDPNALGCDMMTQVASRVPFPAPDSDAAGAADGALVGAITRAEGGLPLGTGLEVRPSTARALPGTPFTVQVPVTAPDDAALAGVRVALEAPKGWRVQGGGGIGRLRPGATGLTRFTVTPPAGADTGERVRLAAHVKTRQGDGYADAPVMVSAPVTARQQYLPQVSDFVAWTDEQGVEQLADIVTPALTIPLGGSREIEYVLENHTMTAQRTTLAVTPPAGFTIDVADDGAVSVPAGGTATVTATVTNIDASMPTSMQGGENGSHRYEITATTGRAVATTTNSLELVPTTTIPQAPTAPVVDGRIADGEYPGAPIDVSRRWEGQECTSAEDCSATAHLAWNDDTLFVAVTVQDDVQGAALAANDCKRHWRTDSVEITIDPRGDSENTSTTFKAAILPWTQEGPACGLRDADNHQGPMEVTAPGMTVASTVNEPYTGYTVEAAIPMSALPGAIDPERMGLNVLVYDSDTPDQVGQTRLGWSVWGGVQGDPYRWGRATLPGYTPPADRPASAPDPIMPLEALNSLDSPQSIEQAAATNVQLAGLPRTADRRAGWAERADRRGEVVRTWIRARGEGRAHVTVRDADGSAGTRVVEVLPGRSRIDVTPTRPLTGDVSVTVGWAGSDGGTLASVIPVR
ncbi:MAG: sugar-binding protein [Mobilicoccus sp.]|nr:sugar-binding protein [Mobilicoccus sp.]